MGIVIVSVRRRPYEPARRTGRTDDVGSPFVPELVDQTLDVATAAILENLEQLAHGRSIGARSP